MMRQRNNTWIQIAVLTLVTALIWLGVSIRATLLKSTVPASVVKLIEPLDPNLDQDVIDNLKSRSGN